jgi:hypothetical protein
MYVCARGGADSECICPMSLKSDKDTDDFKFITFSEVPFFRFRD